MPPQPGVVLDLDRKEELIIAKQLRACRVNIKPRIGSDTDSKSPSPYPPSPATPSSPRPSDTFCNNVFRPVHQFQEEPDPTDWTELRIHDPYNPPWTSSHTSKPGPGAGPYNPPWTSSHTSRPGPGAAERKMSSGQNPSMVTQVPDIRSRVKTGPFINISDYDLENNEQSTSELSPNPYYQNNTPRIHQTPEYTEFKNPNESHLNRANQGSKDIPRAGAQSEVRNQPLVVPLPFLAELRSRRKSETPDSRAKTASEKIQQNYEQKLQNNPHLEEIAMRSSTLQNHLHDTNSLRSTTAVNTLNTRIQQTRSPSPKAVTFSLPYSRSNLEINHPPPQHEHEPKPEPEHEPEPEPEPAPEPISEPEPEPEPTKPLKTKKSSKSLLKITEKTSMSSFANHLIPQLNDMQKNFLGLLLFNELSQNIVDEMVAQQLSMMSGTKIRELIGVIDPQARESARRGLMEDASPRDRAAVVVESLAAMDSSEIAETVINISGYQSVDVVNHMCKFGGRRFKLHLIETLLQGENLKLVKTARNTEEEDTQLGSDGYDDVFESCEEGVDLHGLPSS